MLRVEYMLTFLNNWLIICSVQVAIVVQLLVLHLVLQRLKVAQIAWVKDNTTEIITLTITADDGTVTTMAVPIGDFKF